MLARRALAGPCAVAILAAAAVARAEPAPAAVPQLVRRALAAPETMPVRWPRQPLLEAATRMAAAPAARRRFDVTGRGATVCIVDSGVDLSHADFLDRDGGTRVRWLLDLERSPRGVHPEIEEQFGAAVWSAAGIDAARAAGEPIPGDRHGHGTAVASVAAGDDATAGETTPGRNAGVAPEADLVVVRALRREAPGFYDEDLVAGARFCLAVAGRGPRATAVDRTVIVIAAGGHDGTHDGSEPIERELAALVERGAPVVAAAGNSGQRAVHASASAYDGERIGVPLYVPSPRDGRDERYVAVVVLAEAGGALELALRAPDGTRTAWVRPDEVSSVSHEGGVLTVEGRVAPRPGGRALYAVISGGGEEGAAPLAGGRYALELRGPGRFDAWIAGADLGSPFGGPRFEGPFADTGESVTVPATAEQVIAVGALVSRDELVTDGGTLRAADAQVGRPWPDSSRGPSRTGAPKPDLVAPGGWMRAALSGDLEAGDPHNMLGGSVSELDRRRDGETRIAVRGSSFAAPMVAGALALALEASPSRLARDRALLLATARRLADEAFTAQGGAGTLDVEALLAARRARASEGPVDPRRSFVSATRAGASPGAGELWLVARVLARDGLPMDGTVEVSGPGRVHARLPLVGGTAAGDVAVPEAPFGRELVYAASVDRVSFGTAHIVVRVDDARAHVGTPAGGGCAAAGRPGGRWAALAALWLLLAASRRGGVWRASRAGLARRGDEE